MTRTPDDIDDDREDIKTFSDSLIKIHRLLMEDAFVGLERTRGQLSPVARLQMLLHGAELAWLRPLSQLMAKVDGVLFQKEPVTEKERSLVKDEIRQVFILENDKSFSDKLNAHMALAPVLQQEVAKLKISIVS